MDLGDVGVRIKKSLELDRKIKFVKAQTGLSESQKQRLLAPLEQAVLDLLGADEKPKGSK